VTWRWAVSSWCRGTGPGWGGGVSGGSRWFEGSGCSPGHTTGGDVAVVAVCGRSLGPPVFRWLPGVVTWQSGGLRVVWRRGGVRALAGAPRRAPFPLVPCVCVRGG